MKNKNTIYIGAFSLLFLLLLGIHAYYFYNSYKLKEKDILNTVNSRLSNIEEEIPQFDESPIMDDETLILFSKFENKKNTISEVRNYFIKKTENANPIITTYIDSLFQKQGYKVAIRKEMSNLIVLPTQDTLIREPLVLYQTATPISKVRTLTEGKWTVSSSNSELDLIDYAQHRKKERPDFHFQINRATYYDIANLNQVVLKELTPLMISSILILLSVLLLYYLTYKNLVKHRQESLILHDIVDNISHEFKTPIATLKIATKTLYKDNSIEVLPLIERQIERLENLLKPIYIDEELNTPSITTDEIDIRNLLNDFSFSYPQLILNKHIEILKPFSIYKIEMHTILNNLIDNSIKYGSNQIEVIIKSIPTALVITISDNGIGMDKKELKHILKKFYRIQKNNIQNTKGLGLGLYLVNKIILKHKGNLEIKSKLNSGTTIHITIPNEN